MLGYHGVSSRLSQPPPVGTARHRVNTGRPRAPARCTIDVSQHTIQVEAHHQRRGIDGIAFAIGVGWRAVSIRRRTAPARSAAAADPFATRSTARRGYRPAARRPPAARRAGGRTSRAPCRAPQLMPILKPSPPSQRGPGLDPLGLGREIGHLARHAVRPSRRARPARSSAAASAPAAVDGGASDARDRDTFSVDSRRRMAGASSVTSMPRSAIAARSGELDHVAEALLGQQQQALARRSLAGPARMGERLVGRCFDPRAMVVEREAGPPNRPASAAPAPARGWLRQLRLRLRRGRSRRGVVEPSLLEATLPRLTIASA